MWDYAHLLVMLYTYIVIFIFCYFCILCFFFLEFYYSLQKVSYLTKSYKIHPLTKDVAGDAINIFPGVYLN